MNTMKFKIIIGFVLILLLTVFVNAGSKSFELGISDSYLYNGYNMTLLGIDNKSEGDDKALMCINNQKYIIKDEEIKNINHLSFELENVKKSSVNIKVRTSEEDVCNGTICDNLDCFNNCKTDADCEDINETLVGKCVGERPQKCVYEIVNTDRCYTQEDCDDRDYCTFDICLANGKCNNDYIEGCTRSDSYEVEEIEEESEENVKDETEDLEEKPEDEVKEETNYTSKIKDILGEELNKNILVFIALGFVGLIFILFFIKILKY